MLAEGLEFHPGDGTVCHIGSYDRNEHRLYDESVQTVDYGLDFYAPQTLETDDGRRVMIGWMQSWAGSRSGHPELPFFGQMTIPRELSIREGRLCQWPVRELDGIRRNRVSVHDVKITGRQQLTGIGGRILDLLLTIRPEDGIVYRRFCIRVAEGEGFYSELTVLPEEGIIRMDRTYSGYREDIAHVRDIPAQIPDGRLQLRILMDRYSLELFIGRGESTASMTIYTPLSADGISFSADGAALLDAEKYELFPEG